MTLLPVLESIIILLIEDLKFNLPAISATNVKHNTSGKLTTAKMLFTYNYIDFVRTVIL